MHLNETMAAEKTGTAEVHVLIYFRTSVNWQILALTSNEFHIMLLIIHWFLYIDIFIVQ